MGQRLVLHLPESIPFAMNAVSFAPNSELSILAQQAEQAVRAGDHAAAARMFDRVLVVAPNFSRALNFQAMQAYATGDLARAAELIDRACRGQPRIALAEANRARILRDTGKDPEAIAALQEALKLDPGFLPAMFELGDIHQAHGRKRDAAIHYRQALARVPGGAVLPAPMQATADRARQLLVEVDAELQAHLRTAIEPVRSTQDAAGTARFDECLDIFLGRKKVFLPKPGAIHFPRLPAITFFDRAQFDFIDRLEASTDAVRGELLALLQDEDAGFVPYVQKFGADAGPAWEQLNYSPNWGAYFLWNQGRRIDPHCERCPQTAALLEQLPLVEVPGRAPTAFFSLLRPGAHIPPHHGATNTRLTLHLPLIVPPDCAIRVGNDVHAWREGQAGVFDDTIEHEAWNRSERPRVVLILDVWNPCLSEDERRLVTAMVGALASYYGHALDATEL